MINHLEANKEKIKMENTPPTFIQAFNALFDFFDHMDKNWLFQVIIAFVTFMFIWENYLSYRQVANTLSSYFQLKNISNQIIFQVPCSKNQRKSSQRASRRHRTGRFREITSIRPWQGSIFIYPGLLRSARVLRPSLHKRAAFCLELERLSALLLQPGVVTFGNSHLGSVRPLLYSLQSSRRPALVAVLHICTGREARLQ